MSVTAGGACRCRHDVADHYEGEVCLADGCDCSRFTAPRSTSRDPLFDGRSTRSLESPIGSEGTDDLTLGSVMTAPTAFRDASATEQRIAVGLAVSAARFRSLSRDEFHAGAPGIRDDRVERRKGAIMRAHAAGFSHKQIAEMMNVSKSLVSKTVLDETWKGSADHRAIQSAIAHGKELAEVRTIREKILEERLAEARREIRALKRLAEARPGERCLCGHQRKSHHADGWCEHRASQRFDCRCRRFTRREVPRVV